VIRDEVAAANHEADAEPASMTAPRGQTLHTCTKSTTQPATTIVC